MKSIERHIGSGLALSLLLTLILLGLLAEWGVQRLSHAFVATRLQHDADTLIQALAPAPDGGWQLQEEAMAPIYRRVRSGHYFLVRGEGQTLRSRSLWDRVPLVPELAPGQRRLDDVPRGEEHWLIWSQGIQWQGHGLTLWLAEDLTALEVQWRRFTWLLYGVMAAALVGLLWLQRRLLSRGFRELDKVRRAVQQLQQGEIAALSNRVPREIQPLTTEINRLLARLEQQITRSRTATGNLAHELKRSLQELHLLADALPAADRPACERVLASMERLTERELRRARIAGTPRPGRRFHPAEDIPHLASVLSRIYPAIDVQTVRKLPGPLPFDRDDMLELAGNLLDNGCKFARRRVRLALEQDGCQFCLTVEDDGPGTAQEACDALAGRGVRLDETVAGHGLGLSICRMIVDSYRGTLDFQSGEADSLGGLRVVVRLPLPAAD